MLKTRCFVTTVKTILSDVVGQCCWEKTSRLSQSAVPSAWEAGERAHFLIQFRWKTWKQLWQLHTGAMSRMTSQHTMHSYFSSDSCSIRHPMDGQVQRFRQEWLNLLFYHTGRVLIWDTELFCVASNSLTCLRLLALWHLVPVPLAWLLVLMMCSSSPSGLKVWVSTWASSGSVGGLLKWSVTARFIMLTDHPLWAHFILRRGFGWFDWSLPSLCLSRFPLMLIMG